MQSAGRGAVDLFPGAVFQAAVSDFIKNGRKFKSDATAEDFFDTVHMKTQKFVKGVVEWSNIRSL